jgi:hypothetical protein
MKATRREILAACDACIAAACDFVVRVVMLASRERGMFRIVLPGGGTPQPFYRAVAQGVGAFALVGLEPRHRVLAFIPFLLFNSLYAYWVLRRARAKGLI